mmetsp:Transcript_1677/g.3956  ORF Transcript_1677/g.3956 Transcript_1677/m.3956 type:complete len:629 (-) Transcript_1677:144-2030(-)
MASNGQLSGAILSLAEQIHTLVGNLKEEEHATPAAPRIRGNGSDDRRSSGREGPRASTRGELGAYDVHCETEEDDGGHSQVSQSLDTVLEKLAESEQPVLEICIDAYYLSIDPGFAGEEDLSEHHQAMRYFLEEGCNPNAVEDCTRASCLHYAAGACSRKLCQLLLERGALLEPRDIKLRTPLFWACARPLDKDVGRATVSVCEMLIRRGAICDRVNSKGNTPMHTAVFYGNLELVRLFLNFYKSIDVQGRGLRTPLLLAASRGCSDIVKVLIQAGADPLFRDQHGRTAVHAAADSGEVGICEVLLRRCPDAAAARDGAGRSGALAAKEAGAGRLSADDLVGDSYPGEPPSGASRSVELPVGSRRAPPAPPRGFAPPMRGGGRLSGAGSASSSRPGSRASSVGRASRGAGVGTLARSLSESSDDSRPPVPVRPPAPPGVSAYDKERGRLSQAPLAGGLRQRASSRLQDGADSPLGIPKVLYIKGDIVCLQVLRKKGFNIDLAAVKNYKVTVEDQDTHCAVFVGLDATKWLVRAKTDKVTLFVPQFREDLAQHKTPVWRPGRSYAFRVQLVQTNRMLTPPSGSSRVVFVPKPVCLHPGCKQPPLQDLARGNQSHLKYCMYHGKVLEGKL